MDLAHFLAIFGWSLFFGLLIGLTGIGLGSIGTAGLVMFFQQDPLIAVGTNTLNGFLIKIVGSYRHYRYRHVVLSLTRNLLIGAIPGEVAGVVIGHLTSPALFKRLLGVSLMVVAAALLLDLYMARGNGLTTDADPGIFGARPLKSIVAGVIVGLMVGITSSGSGTLFSAIFLLFYRCLPRLAVGTSVFTANILLFSAALLHMLMGHVDWSLLVALFCGSAPGVFLGTILCNRTPQRVLKLSVTVLIFLAGLKLLF
ncbi:MAG: sulfite exporter TauE/SafE family protein [Acidobacteria bacterium]|nr:sulfite exporter TauE/SafE family protein [Acidobacteriota bacterium]